MWFSYPLVDVNRIPQQHFRTAARNRSYRPAPREVTVIRSMAPVNLIVHYPKSKEGRDKLAKRVSDVHASAVIQRIKSLNCPARQKLALLDAVIKIAKQRSEHLP